MKKLAGWVLTVPHLVAFAVVLLVFHAAQVVARRFGYPAHKVVVDYLSLGILWSLRVAGTSVRYEMAHALPAEGPLIVVANHQSMYDIPLLGWVFRHHHPKFVSKKELGRWLPSVSYNLRHSGSVLIDRADPRQALREIRRLGERIEERGWAACLFPEGTRARDGVMKPFRQAGLSALLKSAPSATVVPVVIRGSWELLRYGMRPVPAGVKVRATVLEPIGRDGRDVKEVAALVEERVRAALATDPAPA